MKIEFTINTTRYESNPSQTYFYATENVGTDKLMIKRRISKADFRAAQDKYEQERKAAELDAATENDEISLEQFVELLQETEISVDTEAGKEIAAEMLGEDIDMEQELETEARMLEEHVGKKAPKAKKARKSKDIAYTYYTDDEHTNALFTLTAKQVDFLHEMVDTMAWDGFDHPLYVDLLVDEIGGQFAGKPMTVGAMISTLCEKGLGERETTRRDNHKCTSFCLTEMGQAVAIDLGL